jgi:hypothetical protein
MFNITGILKSKQAEQQVSEKFRKREFVLAENSSQYPQFISFQLTQDRCSLVESMNAGDEIKVYFNLRGREWTNPQGELKYFNSLEAWKIEAVAPGQPSAQAAASPVVTEALSQSEPDDLPF